MQQSNDAYRRQVDLEHWQRRSGVDSAFRDGWMRAPGNVIGKKLFTTYMECLKEIAVQSRFRAGKYGHLNQYIDNDEALEIGAGDRRAAADRLHGDPGLERRTVGAVLAHWWEPLSGAVPSSQANDGTCPAKQTTSPADLM